MFQTNRVYRSKTSVFFSIVSVIYHTVVNNVRGSHRTAIVGIVITILKSAIMVGVFYAMFVLIGVRSSPIRGDFLLYIMSGVMLYMAHIRAADKVAGAISPNEPTMLHAPMNSIVALISSALSMLYEQTVTVCSMLVLYHLLINPISIDKPIQAYGMLLIAWGSGCAVGLIFGVLLPWFPNAMQLVKRFYMRANMVASGKMFLANTLPASQLALFDWNPLFHAIDQARGFTFLHYTPMNSQIAYPIYLTLALLLIGLMGEFFSRQHASISWFAGR